MKQLSKDDIDRLSGPAGCRALRELPKGWDWKVDTSDRIYFTKGVESTYNHPNLGGLPGRWIFKIIYLPDESGVENAYAVYVDPKVNKPTTKDPRNFDEYNKLQQIAEDPQTIKVTHITRNYVGLSPRNWKRNDITSVNPRHKFMRVKQIGLSMSRSPTFYFYNVSF